MDPDRRRELTLLRRARDEMDRRFAEPLDVAAVAAVARMSPAHFTRRFRAAYDETPHAYLQSRRLERAAAMLRAGRSVTEACTAVGFASLGSFSTRFTRATGSTPSAERRAPDGGLARLPACLVQAAARPVRPAADRAGSEKRMPRHPATVGA